MNLLNPIENQTLHILHVVGLLVLTAYTFFAFAGPADTRKRVMMITGIATLLVLVTGIRMWQAVYGFRPLLWIIVKLVCWIGLSGLAGMAYRKRDKANLLMTVGLVLIIIAVSMVYLQPGSAS